MPKLVCDCGARYEHPDQIIACASVGHGKGGVEEQRLRDLNAELLEALEAAPEPVDNPSEGYVAMWEGWYNNARRAAITKARKE